MPAELIELGNPPHGHSTELKLG